MMQLISFTLIISTVFYVAYASSIQKRVIGGVEVEDHHYPWAASLKGINPVTRSVTYCGATLIADRWLLTASHCFWAGTKKPTHLMEPENWRIQLGSPLIELGPSAASNKQEVVEETKMNLYDLFLRIFRYFKKDPDVEKIVNARASKIILHPKYTPDDLEYDIALVRLSEKVSMESNVSLAKLPRNDNPEKWPPVESKCTFIGWGCQKLNGGPSSRARVVALKVLPNKDCSEMYNHAAGLNPDHEFCAGYYKSEVGICAGDSGSGLIYLYKRQPVVVGIASATHGRNPQDFPGLFTRVSAFTDWIMNTVAENS